MTHQLPLGIPNLPAPPHVLSPPPAGNVTYIAVQSPPPPPYAVFNQPQHLTPTIPQASRPSNSQSPGRALNQNGPDSPHMNSSAAVTPVPNTPPPNSSWRNYMQGLGQSMGRLDLACVNSPITPPRDKPLPPMPARSAGPPVPPPAHRNRYSTPPVPVAATHPSPIHVSPVHVHPHQSNATPPVPPRPNHPPIYNQNWRAHVWAVSPVAHSSSMPTSPVQHHVPPSTPPKAIQRPSPSSPKTNAHRPSPASPLKTHHRMPLPSSSPKPQAKLSFVARVKAAAASPLSPPPKSKPAQSPKSPTSPHRPPPKSFIDLTYSSDESDTSYTPSEDEREPLPPRRKAHRRAASQPPVQTPRKIATPRKAVTPQGMKKTQAATTPKATTPSTPAVRCAGFTRNGQPCKRLVKSGAPYLAQRNSNDSDGDADAQRVVGRYCKDHAGLVCAADGFYWRDAKGKAGVWVEFEDFIPADLGQQTQTLLRMTMESPLTAKELPGFLYAYELRDLAAPTTSYFKVGRTDNVPRRIGQWTKQCTSHTPTLRDIFPLKSAALNRQASAVGSLLPGAVKGGTDNHRMVPAVKRWERLVHLELSDRSATQRGADYDALLKPCSDCGAIHKEIFPLADKHGQTHARNGCAYESVVVETVARWERFIRLICES